MNIDKFFRGKSSVTNLLPRLRSRLPEVALDFMHVVEDQRQPDSLRPMRTHWIGMRMWKVLCVLPIATGCAPMLRRPLLLRTLPHCLWIQNGGL